MLIDGLYIGLPGFYCQLFGLTPAKGIVTKLARIIDI